MNRLRVVLLLVGIAFGPCLSDRVLAQDDAEPQDTEDLRRKTPSGQYIDPASFFRFHGYVTLTYAEPQAEFGSEIGVPPQILVSGRSPRTGENEGGFKNDGALFIGGEPFEGVGSVVELHFVGNALEDDNPDLSDLVGHLRALNQQYDMLAIQDILDRIGPA